jgi:hypothetical protein
MVSEINKTDINNAEMAIMKIAKQILGVPTNTNNYIVRHELGLPSFTTLIHRGHLNFLVSMMSRPTASLTEKVICSKLHRMFNALVPDENDQHSFAYRLLEAAKRAGRTESILRESVRNGINQRRFDQNAFTERKVYDAKQFFEKSLLDADYKDWNRKKDEETKKSTDNILKI